MAPTKNESDTVQLRSRPRWVEVFAVAVLFAVCGASSSSLFLQPFPNNKGFLFPIPFACLSALLFMRNAKAIFAIPLMAIAWQVSFFAAYVIGPTFNDPIRYIVPGCLGGLIGGFALVYCSALCHPSLLKWKHVLIGTAIGLAAGTAFIPWNRAYTSNLDRGLGQVPFLAFAIWEAAVGTCLYVFWSGATRIVSTDE